MSAGAATITENANRLDVHQHTDKAVIDWRGFDIKAHEHTNFNQPSASAIALNRVNSGGPSQIDGRLTANGRIFVINQNGVIFGRDARVSVAGLIATTSDIGNQDFLDGRYQFASPSDNSDAAVVNLGSIEVHEGGTAVLAAPRVGNEGTIHARLGRVALAGANSFTVDFEGDGLLSFDLGAEITQAPTDAGGEPVAALVRNTGDIIADGGVVTLSAQAADSVVDRVINMEGVVQARAVAQRGGTIVLSGGEHGIVAASGTLDASGADAGQSGGTVKVLGEKVALLDGARVTVEGDSGGGEVLVGGNFQGKGPEPNARHAHVSPDASINADARGDGDGGRVIVWADETTRYYGDISARGGAEGGDGGFVEVSGKQALHFVGTADVGADLGTSGTVLLDPVNLTIQGGSANDDAELSDSQVLFADGGSADFELSDVALEALTGNILLQAVNDITLTSGADLDLSNQGPGESVTFEATGSSAGSLSLNAPITTAGASVVLIYNRSGTEGGIVVDAAAPITTNGGNITITATGDPPEPNVFIGSALNAGGGNITFTANNVRLFTPTGSSTQPPASLQSVGGSLLFEPLAATDAFEVGGVARFDFNEGSSLTTLTVDQDEIGTIQDGFAAITFGSTNGAHAITVDSATFQDPVTFRTPAGGSINVTNIGTNGSTIPVQGLDNASLTFTGPAATPTTISGAVQTAGNAITVTNDLNPVGATLNTTVGSPTGANITLSNIASNGGNLTLNAGTSGNIVGQSGSNIGTLQIVQSASTTFNGDQTAITTIQIDDTEGAVTFNGQLGASITGQELTSLVTTAQGYSVNLLGGASILSATTFLNTGGVTFGNDSTDVAEFLGALVSTAGTTSTFGTVLSNSPVNFGAWVLNGETELDTTNTVSGNDITVGQVTSNGNTAVFESGTANVIATNAANDFSTVRLILANDVTLVDTNAIDLAASSVTGTLSVTAGSGISQSGALSLAGTASFNAGAGSLLLTNTANDFSGAVSLSNTGANAVSIVDTNALSLGVTSVGSGAFTVMADNLNIVGALSGSGPLNLGPLDLSLSIGIGDGATGVFNLTSAEIANLSDGFSAITIGKVGGTHAVDIQTVAFTDPFVMQANGAGAAIALNGNLTGNDNASITFNGSGQSTTLNGDITTAENAITLNDAIVLGDSVALDTGTGTGDITLNGTLNGTNNLDLSAGTGNVQFTGDVGGATPLGNTTIGSASDVTIDGTYAGGDTDITYTGLLQALTDPSLDLTSLTISANAAGATLFGTVAGASGIDAALTVGGPVGSAAFTINGCVVGVTCTTTTVVPTEAEPRTDSFFDSPSTLASTAEFVPLFIGGQYPETGDPRDGQFSNFGNEELWAGQKVGEEQQGSEQEREDQ